MSGRMLHPALQKLAALVILGVVLGAALASTVYPLIEAMAARDAAAARLARYQDVLKAPAAAEAAYDPDDLSGLRVDHAEAQLALQAVVDKLARAAGITPQSIQPLPAEHLGDIGRGVWIEVTFTSDLQGLTDFLASFDAERPLVLARRLEVERGDGPRPDLFLRIKVEVGQVWRATGDGA